MSISIRIKAINPNTTLEMAENIGEQADHNTRDDADVVAVSPKKARLVSSRITTTT